MDAWILSIGDELLLGQTVNTNAAYLGQKLTDLGFNVRRILTIPDRREDILQTLEQAAGKTRLLISTGGLGPTSDDITKQTLLEFFGGQMREDPQVLNDVKHFLEIRGRQMTPRQREQALVPDTAKIIRNPYGTAPGLWFERQGTVFVFMPGVPFEMQQMFEENLEPLLRRHFDLPAVYMRFVHTYGLPEADLASRLEDFERELPRDVKIAYLPSPEDIKIRLWASGRSVEQIKPVIDSQVRKLSQLIPDVIWGYDGDTMPSVVLRLFTSAGLTLSTAESCTGGNIAHMITSVPGSSQYYRGTVVAYANDVKQRVLGVNAADLESYGAVSQPVVEQMALGVKRLIGTDFSVATSGIAGPTGGTPEKPVGTVWIAVATPGRVVSKLHRFGPRRDINIRRSSAMALFMLIKEAGQYTGKTGLQDND